MRLFLLLQPWQRSRAYAHFVERESAAVRVNPVTAFEINDRETVQHSGLAPKLRPMPD